MRVLFSLAALVVCAQALSRSFYQKRAGLDICANVACSVSLPSPLTWELITFGDIDVCTCLSGVPALVGSHPILVGASLIVGISEVTNFVTGQVTKGGSSCSYPDHAVPVCSKENPCGFGCSNGFTPYGGKCVCNPLYTECNGVCGLFPYCPSNGIYKRDADEWKGRVQCDKGHTACGVSGRSMLIKQPYECVDTRNDLESCGGCSIPLHRGSPLGTDCTSLPGIADVSCINGSCYIHKCMPGYQLSVDNSMCMDDETVKKFLTIAESGWEQFIPVRFD